MNKVEGNKTLGKIRADSIFPETERPAVLSLSFSLSLSSFLFLSRGDGLCQNTSPF